ncbi:LOW QUALITY PROTEIN: apoptosis-resistant E3 ubiquitin protein ligase 1 [Hemiscyllium ocellatum]|uniref:LOW QUALITY PROTEIN: apoptosis-resistant E3 ubiquitin protein ligase 1 n=1 Tax=Hemiscyllium ocellatum TaxID=170820 RepID=UPI002966E039|nr:LOW QUALITY PROTEIN: apoptosis-resistant E3 ubiquitin protein ligase 1 [Hemiscyllium ocellatum]
MDRCILTFLLTFCLCVLAWELRWKNLGEKQIKEWINANNLLQYKVLFDGVQNLDALAVPSTLFRLKVAFLDDCAVQKIEAAQCQLVKELALQEWLFTQGQEHRFHVIKSLSCSTLTDLIQFDSESQVALTARGYIYGDYHRKILEITKSPLEWEHKLKLVHNLVQRRRVEKWSVVGAVVFASSTTLRTLKRDLMFIVVGGIAVSIIAFLFTAKFLYELFARVISFLQNDNRGRRGNRTIYDYVRGNYLDPRSCLVTWDWKDSPEVGHIMTFRIHLFYKNGRPFPAHRPVGLRIHISHMELGLDVPVTQEVLHAQKSNVVKVGFTVRKAGRYELSIKVGGSNVAYSPYYKTFQPGSVFPAKTKILYHFSTLVLTSGQQHTLQIAPRDEYDNPTSNALSVIGQDDYKVQIKELGGPENEMSDVLFHKTISLNKSKCLVLLNLTLWRKGCFRASVTYWDQLIGNGVFDIIVLSDNEKNTVEKNVSTPGTSVCFEAYLYNTANYANSQWQLPSIPPSSMGRHPSTNTDEEDDEKDLDQESQTAEKVKKPKKVYCYISPKQFSVKEFYLKIIPWRLFTCRVCPGTKFYYHSLDPVHKFLTLVVDDGIQPPVELSCKERNIMAATFIRFLHKNIGGSETFQDKVNFFQRELRQMHMKRSHTKIVLKISRHSFLESSLKATRNFSVSDWSKNFEVIFQDEEALDWGGPRREWFELMCKALFDQSNGLFMHFSDNNQGLVHPNPDRSPHLRLKLYEFAGKVVGKCLYESAQGGAYKQLVCARFTRSFLAQIIGLRMHYKYFATDDPEFYKSKVCYILKNDMSEMDLVFAEEKYNKSGHLEKVIELIAGGAQMPVTNDNKIFYLNMLAQYRLASQVRQEVEYFLKGLNELIPENLLAIFDENELELLMCGTGNISVPDFKTHAVIVGGSWHFREKVMKWFWTVVSSFTQEELARLLQFTTGSSQLPPGGFVAMCPSFQIIAAPTQNTLPTAHTCFNQLCLPTYDSYEELHKMLKLAINEGSEGFGML